MSPIFVIILMAVVTIGPRIIPAFIVDLIKFPNWVGRWLEAVPYAALGALIFPGILNVLPDRPLVGLIGGIVAIVLSLLRVHTVLIVLGASAVVYFML
ncbi:AzlD domain-containing protein [Amphibacillus sediminis]|uniref:AzlD domain-containing protein n=1 Tax=Amphibacillus sediminis TaxID=360185 RepID=UPI0008367CBF|nr:AzlD domain-containing protein [Amphibacillus sediminis]